MSCIHACVGSFGVIKWVCDIGEGGRFGHLAPPSPRIDGFHWGVVAAGPPIFAIRRRRNELNKVQKHLLAGNDFLLFFRVLFASLTSEKPIGPIDRIANDANRPPIRMAVLGSKTSFLIRA